MGRSPSLRPVLQRSNPDRAKTPTRSVSLLLGGLFQLNADVLYTVTNLGGVPGISTGKDINDAGQIVTTSFLYSNGQRIDLMTFSANAINNAGQVVGEGSTDMPFSTATGRSPI